MTEKAALVGVSPPDDRSKIEMVANLLGVEQSDVSFWDAEDKALDIARSVVDTSDGGMNGEGSAILVVGTIPEQSMKAFKKLTRVGVQVLEDYPEVDLNALEPDQVRHWMEEKQIPPEQHDDDDFDPLADLLLDEDDSGDDDAIEPPRSPRGTEPTPIIDPAEEEAPPSMGESGIPLGGAPPMPDMLEDDERGSGQPIEEPPEPAYVPEEPSRDHDTFDNEDEQAPGGPSGDAQRDSDDLPPIPGFESIESQDESPGEAISDDEAPIPPLAQVNDTDDSPHRVPDPEPYDDEDYGEVIQDHAEEPQDERDFSIIPGMDTDSHDDDMGSFNPQPRTLSELNGDPEPEPEATPPLRFKRTTDEDAFPPLSSYRDDEQDDEANQIDIPEYRPSSGDDTGQIQYEDDEPLDSIGPSRRDPIELPSEYSRASNRPVPSSGARGYEEQNAEINDLDDGINFDRPPLRPEDPTYTENLSYEDRERQNLDRRLKQRYGSSQHRPANAGHGRIFYSTSSHGGAGNTTFTWVVSNATAMAMRRVRRKAGSTSENDRPVWLIESDYRNPKLQERLNTDRHLGNVADTVRRLRGDLNVDILRDVIYDNTEIQDDTGLRIVPCPYDIQGYQEEHIKYAIVSAVKLAASEGGYVFIDSGQLTSDGMDDLDTKLAHEMSHRAFVVSDAGHLSDMRRTLNILTSRNIQRRKHQEQVHIFLNRSRPEQVREAQELLAPYRIDGWFPHIPEIDVNTAPTGKAWVGYTPQETLTSMVYQAGMFMHSIGNHEIGSEFSNRVPVQRDGWFRRLLKVFGAR